MKQPTNRSYTIVSTAISNVRRAIKRSLSLGPFAATSVDGQLTYLSALIEKPDTTTAQLIQHITTAIGIVEQSNRITPKNAFMREMREALRQLYALTPNRITSQTTPVPSAAAAAAAAAAADTASHLGQQLYEAAGAGDVDAVSRLLDANADPNFTLTVPKTHENQHFSYPWIDLFDAYHAKSETDPNYSPQAYAQVQADGTTVLMRAASNGHTEIVRMLIARGAKVNPDYKSWVGDNCWKTPLTLASNSACATTVRLLLAAGAHTHIAPVGWSHKEQYCYHYTQYRSRSYSFTAFDYVSESPQHTPEAKKDTYRAYHEYGRQHGLVFLKRFLRSQEEFEVSVEYATPTERQQGLARVWESNPERAQVLRSRATTLPACTQALAEAAHHLEHDTVQALLNAGANPLQQANAYRQDEATNNHYVHSQKTDAFSQAVCAQIRIKAPAQMTAVGALLIKAEVDKICNILCEYAKLSEVDAATKLLGHIHTRLRNITHPGSTKLQRTERYSRWIAKRYESQALDNALRSYADHFISNCSCLAYTWYYGHHSVRPDETQLVENIINAFAEYLCAKCHQPDATRALGNALCTYAKLYSAHTDEPATTETITTTRTRTSTSTAALLTQHGALALASAAAANADQPPPKPTTPVASPQ